MNEELYLIALANKIAAEQGLIECGMILKKLGRIEAEFHSEEIMAEMNEAHDRVLEHEAKLRQILFESEQILNQLNAANN